MMYRSSHRRCFVRKNVLRNFPKFTWKHLCQSLSLVKLKVSACNFIKRESLAQVFSCEFCKISKNSFFIKHFRATASKCSVLQKQWLTVLKNTLNTSLDGNTKKPLKTPVTIQQWVLRLRNLEQDSKSF